MGGKFYHKVKNNNQATSNKQQPKEYDMSELIQNILEIFERERNGLNRPQRSGGETLAFG